MKSKFTKGPWSFHELQDGARDGLGYIRCDADFLEIAHHGDDRRSRATNLANAALLSAAPDMFEALSEAVDVLDGMCDDEINAELMPRLRAALAKARGQ